MSAPKKKKILTRQFDYRLPEKLIAQAPAKPRDHARLLILDRKTKHLEHRRFFEIGQYLRAGDVLVLNNSKVIPARLLGRKETGGKIEIFLLTKFLPLTKGEGKRGLWQCLIGGKAKPGQKIILKKLPLPNPFLGRANRSQWSRLSTLASHRFCPSFGPLIKGRGKHFVTATVIKKLDDKTWLVDFDANDKKIFSYGQTPLPPYIKKNSSSSDYQTIYAKISGSVAAPTAGLHFTKRLLNELKKRGIRIEYVTLHVGLGTFAPVKTKYIEDHHIHTELATIDKKTADRLNRAKREGRRIIAVGTTSVRTLEAFSADTKTIARLQPKSDWINIFIYPGYQFKFVDAIITNFHLPKSTLLMLASAFAGQNVETLRRNVSTDAAINRGNKLIKHAYAEAIRKKYKFYSFGDAMFIE